MTTIAWDGKVLAGDSRWIDNDLIVVRRTKLERFASGSLYGSAGDSEDRELKALLAKVKRASQMPTFAELSRIRTDGHAILVLPDGRAFEVKTCRALPESEKFEVGVLEVDAPFAVGSGREIAYGALDRGATAFEAVKTACGRDPKSGEPVTRLTLNPRSSFKGNKRK